MGLVHSQPGRIPTQYVGSSLPSIESPVDFHVFPIGTTSQIIDSTNPGSRCRRSHCLGPGFRYCHNLRTHHWPQGLGFRKTNFGSARKNAAVHAVEMICFLRLEMGLSFHKWGDLLTYNW